MKPATEAYNDLLAAFRELVAAAEADGWDIHNPATLAKARADLAKAEARS